MTMRAMKMVAAARACLGARFRSQGRDPLIGLDCLGLALVALRAGGMTGGAPADYRLRGDHLARLVAGLAAVGLERVDRLQPGGLVVMETGPMQWHLAIWTGSGLIHADAQLGRVVEMPGPPCWPVCAIWAWPKGDK